MTERTERLMGLLDYTEMLVSHLVGVSTLKLNDILPALKEEVSAQRRRFLINGYPPQK